MYFNPGGFDPILFATKWQWAFTQNVTKVWGTHTAKAGFFWENVRNAQPGNNNSNGNVISDNWGAGNTGNTFADVLTGLAGGYNESTQNAVRDIVYDRFEFYAQDAWKMSPGFTLNYGARVLVLRALDRLHGLRPGHLRPEPLRRGLRLRQPGTVPRPVLERHRLVRAGGGRRRQLVRLPTRRVRLGRAGHR